MSCLGSCRGKSGRAVDSTNQSIISYCISLRRVKLLYKLNLLITKLNIFI